jgi:murein DD-endopeptidase MepM/ murein hydrolase activator NlpD
MNKREGIHILKGKVMAVLCAVMAAVVLFSALSPAVYAQTDEERIKELQRQADELQKKIDAANEQLKKIAGDKAQEQKYINELNAQIEALQKQINAYNSSIDIIDSQIKSLDNQIIETKSKISKKEAEKQKLEEEVAALEGEIDDTYLKLKERLRAIYMNGTTSDWEILLSGKDLSMYFLRTELTEGIAKHDNQLIAGLKERISALQSKKEQIKKEIDEINEEQQKLKQHQDTLDEKKDALNTQKKKVSSSKSTINTKLEESTKLLRTLNKESETYKKLVKKYEQDKAEFEAEINRILNNESSSGSGSIVGGGKMIWPVPYSNCYITSPYGYRNDPFTGKWTGHGGVDISIRGGAYGKNIVAVLDGTVVIATYHYSYGNYLAIDHGNGLVTIYAHCSKLLVGKGDRVKQGQVIALIGSTGSSTGPHLHFEVRVNNVRQDPMKGYISLP